MSVRGRTVEPGGSSLRDFHLVRFVIRQLRQLRSIFPGKVQSVSKGVENERRYFGLLGPNGDLYQEDELYNYCSASNSAYCETSYVIVALRITILAPWFGPLAHALDLSRKNQPKLADYKTDQVEIVPMGSPWVTAGLRRC